MKISILFALGASCSHFVEPPMHLESSQTTSEMCSESEALSHATPMTTGPTLQSDSESELSHDESSESGLDASEWSTFDDSSDGELESESGESEASTESDGWGACDGDVPSRCLDITDDSASCPGTVGSCSWHRCASDRSTRWRIEYLECLVDECGFEPVHDLDCLSEWADLALECFDKKCEPDQPQACAFINRGAEHECHR